MKLSHVASKSFIIVFILGFSILAIASFYLRDSGPLSPTPATYTAPAQSHELSDSFADMIVDVIMAVLLITAFGSMIGLVVFIVAAILRGSAAYVFSCSIICLCGLFFVLGLVESLISGNPFSHEDTHVGHALLSLFVYVPIVIGAVLGARAATGR